MSDQEIDQFPCVYVWWRVSQRTEVLEDCLYVGKAAHITQRLVKHHIIGTHDRLRANDRIELHFCRDNEEVIALEHALILKYEPLYNQVTPLSDKERLKPLVSRVMRSIKKIPIRRK